MSEVLERFIRADMECKIRKAAEAFQEANFLTGGLRLTDPNEIREQELSSLVYGSQYPRLHEVYP